MEIINPASIARAVVFGGLVLGLLLGVVGQATRFCVRGAIADWVERDNRDRFAGWMLAVGVGAIGLQTLAATGRCDAGAGRVDRSYVSARLRREFKLEGFESPREFGEHVLGAVMMGFGGVTALGCSIGNGVTGLAWLSSGSMLAVAGISGGAWLALRRSPARVLRAAAA